VDPSYRLYVSSHPELCEGGLAEYLNTGGNHGPDTSRRLQVGGHSGSVSVAPPSTMTGAPSSRQQAGLPLPKSPSPPRTGESNSSSVVSSDMSASSSPPRTTSESTCVPSTAPSSIDEGDSALTRPSRGRSGTNGLSITPLVRSESPGQMSQRSGGSGGSGSDSNHASRANSLSVHPASRAAPGPHSRYANSSMSTVSDYRDNHAGALLASRPPSRDAPERDPMHHNPSAPGSPTADSAFSFETPQATPALQDGPAAVAGQSGGLDANLLFKQVEHMKPEDAAQKVKSIVESERTNSRSSTEYTASTLSNHPVESASVASNASAHPLSPSKRAALELHQGRGRANSVLSTKTSISKHTVDSISSAKTMQTGAADSIFRLLPRETRNCLTRMMTIDPKVRCSLADLLRGGDKGQEDEDEVDEWLAGISPCVGFGAKHKRESDPDWHAHNKIHSDEGLAPPHPPKESKKKHR